MNWLNFFAEWLNLKGVLIACLIFVPLERLLAMHPLQRTFRRGWWNDVIYLFVNGWLIKLGLLIIIAGAMVVFAWLIRSERSRRSQDAPCSAITDRLLARR